MNTPPLGFIRVQDRTREQHDAHARAMAGIPHVAQFALQAPTLAAGQKACLYDFWKDPRVVADCGGIAFSRFHQLTGSCVGAGGGNAVFSLIAVQRCRADAPTKAFIPWWPLDYGISRLDAGMHGQGEGSLGSTFAQAVRESGVIDAVTAGLPKFDQTDGLTLTERVEMQWSDGARIDRKYLDAARVHPVGATAECRDVGDVKAAILNGYPVTFACDNYIGRASVQGEGENACVIGYWDGSGGHQQSIHAYWEHPTLGPLYWAQNNWGGDTYPRDPAGGPMCGCWVKEGKVAAAMRLDAEVFALSHLSWFPAQPDVFSWD